MRSQKSDQKFLIRSGEEDRGALASLIARRLVEIEYRGFGDHEGALRRLAARTGISYSTWRDWWHHTKTKGVLPSTWEKLVTAYQVECARQVRSFGQELKIARRLRGDETNSIVVRAAIAAAGIEESPPNTD